MGVLKKIFLFFWEHKSDALVLLFICSVFGFILDQWDSSADGDENKYLLMPAVVAAGFFLAWVQFLSNKSAARKEAALTYYPKPMELEEVENDIDRVINFWSSSFVMPSYEIKLMLDEEISDAEYRLCWERLSAKLQREIFDTYKKYYEATGFLNPSMKGSFNEDCLPYKKQYSHLIREKFVDVRRKFHLYLNQIEGFCLAINSGNVDSTAAKDMYEHKMKNHFRKAKPYIDEVRKRKGDARIYIQFEKVVRKWDG